MQHYFGGLQHFNPTTQPGRGELNPGRTVITGVRPAVFLPWLLGITENRRHPSVHRQDPFNLGHAYDTRPMSF